MADTPPIIERFFPGVERTRASLALAEAAHQEKEILHYAFERGGLRLRRPRNRGQSALERVQGLDDLQRLEASRDLFQLSFPLLQELHASGRHHGAVHPGNLSFHKRLGLVDIGLNRCTLFPFGAGPIPAQSGQLDYRVWLWSVSRPTVVQPEQWDLACLLGSVVQLAVGPAGWSQPWSPADRLGAIERWAEAFASDLPQGADDAPRLRHAMQASMLVEACL